MTNRFHSNGKLLLSAEYAILDGALGLAVPTTYGQSLHITSNKTGVLHWMSKDHNDTPWFEFHFELNNIKLSKASSKTGETLKKILLAAQRLNPEFLTGKDGFTAESKVDFPMNWGLGSSSTLINNISNWAAVDPYKLLRETFGGSGYDIACARHNSALLYRLDNHIPTVQEISLDLPFKSKLYFVHLNKKKDSREGIFQYREQHFDKALLINQITEITENMVNCKVLSEFESLMLRHESLLSAVLGLPTVKATLFPDYPFAIKSLGAWGGDFILAAGNEQSPHYFNSKGYEVVIPYEKMVLS